MFTSSLVAHFDMKRGVRFLSPLLRPLKRAGLMKHHRLKGSHPVVLGRAGSLEVKLAHLQSEIKAAQRLRYRVFFQEMSARAHPLSRLKRRDSDHFDAHCDHLLVLDHAAPRRFLKPSAPRVVGTYRLLRQDVAQRHNGFYSQAEFNINALVERHPDKQFLELGRSCVLRPYRNKRTIDLLWQGIWHYLQLHSIDVMVGCASFEGVDAHALRQPLSFLHHFCAPPAEWQVAAQAHRRLDMALMNKDEIDSKAALRALPPLIRGYLRLGAFIGEGAVLDAQFGTIDVLIILPVAALSERYVKHYSTD